MKIKRIDNTEYTIADFATMHNLELTLKKVKMCPSVGTLYEAWFEEVQNPVSCTYIKAIGPTENCAVGRLAKALSDTGILVNGKLLNTGAIQPVKV